MSYAAELLGLRRYGWKPSLPDARDVMAFATPLTPLHTGDLPVEFSLRDKMPPVYDQLSLGSCTANAIAAALQYKNIVSGTDFGVPSRLFIYYCERVREQTVMQDAGAYGRDGFASLRKSGAPPETVWPYVIEQFASTPSSEAFKLADSHRIEHYTHARSTAAEVMQLIYEGKPVAFGMNVPESFESEDCMTTGIMPAYQKGEQFLGGHEMLAMGWTSDFIECRNSWGPNVMDHGYVYIPRAFLFGGYASDFRAIQS